MAAPPDSNWWGIQAFKIDDAEYEKLTALHNESLNQPGYMPFEIGNHIEFSRRNINVIWIGTARNSFFKYDMSDGSYQQYNYDDKNIFSSHNSS